MDRSKKVFIEVEALYKAATTSMGAWMWRNHTQWVANKATTLAKKYGADVEKVYCAALLHDIGDAIYERNHANFETWSWETGKTILKTAGFRHDDRKEIMQAVSTHSCHPGHLPLSLEGKVLATADGMWHIQTNFFPVICYMNRPDTTKTYEQWQTWFADKIERDFGPKIFFEEERAEIADDYAVLKKVFGSKGLDDTKAG